MHQCRPCPTRRLTLGYLGNLSERVEWLGPFLVLTVIPQMVVHFYFAVGQYYAGWITLDIEVLHPDSSL